MALKDRIREVRDGMSREKFATTVGVSVSTIKNYETGATQPKMQVLEEICMKFDVNMSWLMSGEGDPKQKPLSHPLIKNELQEYDTEYEKGGGWRPRTSAKEWQLVAKAVEILGSGTIYAEALESNIHAFYQAVRNCGDDDDDQEGTHGEPKGEEGHPGSPSAQGATKKRAER